MSPIRRSLGLVALAAVLAVTAAGCGGGSGTETQADAFRGIELPDSPPAPGFSLYDQNGKLVTLSSHRGHWVLLTFLYTYCPDVCPVIAGNLNAALPTGPARRAGLKVLSISVDPKRDTPAAAREYVKNHNLHPGFSWLLGSQNELARVWNAYNIAVLPGAKKTVSHSTVQLLVDPEGRERLLYDADVQTADIVADLRTLERE